MVLPRQLAESAELPAVKPVGRSDGITRGGRARPEIPYGSTLIDRGTAPQQRPRGARRGPDLSRYSAIALALIPEHSEAMQQRWLRIAPTPGRVTEEIACLDVKCSRQKRRCGVVWWLLTPKYDSPATLPK